jgi:hypothetical protein
VQRLVIGKLGRDHLGEQTLRGQTLLHRLRRQRSHGHAIMAALAGPHPAHRPHHLEGGRDVVDLFALLLEDPSLGRSASAGALGLARLDGHHPARKVGGDLPAPGLLPPMLAYRRLAGIHLHRLVRPTLLVLELLHRELELAWIELVGLALEHLPREHGKLMLQAGIQAAQLRDHRECVFQRGGVLGCGLLRREWRRASHCAQSRLGAPFVHYRLR